MTFRGLRMWAIAELDLLRLRAAALFRAPHPTLSPSVGEGDHRNPLPLNPLPLKGEREG